jgi:beta-glucuronidase
VALDSWKTVHVRVEFEAVTHTAHVFLNGELIGQHIGKGYTAFTVDLSPNLHFGEENALLVRVDNRPADRMLPRNRSYDWADDGGIIRHVNLLITPQVYIERVEIDAVPKLADSSAEIRLRAFVRNTTSKAQPFDLHASFRPNESPGRAITPLHASHAVAANSEEIIEIGPGTVRNAVLWHFDSPNLYLASLSLKSALGEQSLLETFGIRHFEVRGAAFYLNGEKVSLIGVERMAGSNPDFGMAETLEWIQKNHEDMKKLNCVFSRVHWPQDRRVLDFCDRNGILMQEEVPAWGWETFHDTSDEVQHALEQNGLEQLREMVARDRNHPSIVAWGLCNEVDGKNPRSRQFAHKLGDEARRLDPSRLQTYASNSLDSDPGADMAGDFDFISTNEYYGSWAPGGPQEVRAHLDQVRKAFAGKPIVVSEYGWCECQPGIMPGDDLRVDIVNSHTEAFREFAEVAGAIYFDYNDYRTLAGDKGTGALRQRVHGVVDLYGKPKPSFTALRLQSSPIEQLSIQKTGEFEYKLNVSLRRQLPGYTLRGYVIRCTAYGYDDLPMAGHVSDLPALQAGSSHSVAVSFQGTPVRRIVVDVMRPTGFSAITAEYLDKAAME